jgi:SHS2 domain-containing protein
VSPAPVPDAGYRLLPHTADTILETWGPTREACLEQAVVGLVAGYAQVPAAATTTRVPIRLGPDVDAELLILLLEEVIYLQEVRGVLPVGADLRAIGGEGGDRIEGSFTVVSLDDAVEAGAVPKAVSRHEIEIGPEDGRWACRVTIDV